jgi:hypothetical protein
LIKTLILLILPVDSGGLKQPLFFNLSLNKWNCEAGAFDFICHQNGLIMNKTNQNLVINSKRKIDILLTFGADKELDTSLDKLIVFQIAKYRANIEQLQLEFKSFEAIYKMSSEDFYNKFESGKLGDDADFFEWAGLYENHLLYTDRIKSLEDAINK